MLNEIIRTRMSAAEFLALPETTQPTELLEAEMIVSPSPVPDHQNVIGDTFVLLKTIAKQIGGRVYQAPLDVYFDEENISQPDVMWLAPESQCSVGAKHLIGAPELIVEVLSPGSVKRDKIDKYRLYERYQVREYWLIDPIEKYMEVFTLRDGRFQLFGVFAPDDVLESPLLKSTIDVKIVFGS